MDTNTLKKICKIVLKKDKKKKGKKKGKKIKIFEEPSTRGAFPIPGQAGFGTYGRPYGYTPPSGGTTIIARDMPLEVIKRPPVKLVGNLLEEDKNEIIKETIEEPKKITFQKPRKIILEPDEYSVSEISDISEGTSIFEPFIEDPQTGRLYLAKDKADIVELESLSEPLQDELFKSQIPIILENIQQIRNLPSDIFEKPKSEQSTEILEPELNYSIIMGRAKEEKERNKQIAERAKEMMERGKIISEKIKERKERTQMSDEDL